MPRKNFSQLSKRRRRDYLKIVEMNAKCNSEPIENPNLVRQSIAQGSRGNAPLGPLSVCQRTMSCDPSDSAESISATSESEQGSLLDTIDGTDNDESTNTDEDNDSERMNCSDNTSDSLDELISDTDNELDVQDLQNGPNPGDDPESDCSPPIYAGAPITVRESNLLLLSLLTKHNLNQSCLSDIIDLVNLHCAEADFKKNSLYKFKKYFNLSELSHYKKHHYCSACCHGLDGPDSVCPNCEDNDKTSHFIELPFLDQLRELYKRRGFYESLQHKLQREIPPNTMNDIYDGELYRNLINLGFASNPHHITLSWYLDGIPVFKSSKVSMTPVYLSINELPFSSRIQRANILLAGLIFGKKKLGIDNLLRKLSTQFETLASGIDIVLPQGNIINVRGLMLSGTCDLPAKSDILNIKQFNGEWGCPNCEVPGETCNLQTGGSTHVYPYTEHATIRTSSESIQYGKEALVQSKPIFGWKGPCMISKLMPDFIKGTGIDRMHAVDGGVIKKLLNLWFGPPHRTSPFSLLEVVDIVNDRLKSIKPPKSIHRMPRSVEELCHWKSSELKMWAFYYSLPILGDVMRADFFENYTLLIISISILSSDSITNNMTNVAENLLQQFVRGFQELYGLQFCSINIHQLLHLARCVRSLGPLWGYTCYPYEDLNGQLLKTIHGTRHIDSQIANAHMQLVMMRRHLELLPEGPVKDFCLCRKKQVKICEKLSESCYAVGTYSKDIVELPAEIREAMNNSRIAKGRIQIYKRLSIRGKMVVSEIYFRDISTQSSHIQYVYHDEERIGSIYCFIKLIPDCECMVVCECEPLHYAITRVLLCQRVFGAYTDTQDEEYIPLLHLFKSQRQHEIIALPVKQILSVCVYMAVDDQAFIGLPLNCHELE